MFFGVSMITWPRIPKIGTHGAFINSYIESKFQLSRFYCLLIVMSRSILICQKSRTKTKVLRAHVKSQLHFELRALFQSCSVRQALSETAEKKSLPFANVTKILLFKLLVFFTSFRGLRVNNNCFLGLRVLTNIKIWLKRRVCNHCLKKFWEDFDKLKQNLIQMVFV